MDITMMMMMMIIIIIIIIIIKYINHEVTGSTILNVQ